MRIGYSNSEAGAAIRIPAPSQTEIISEIVMPMRKTGVVGGSAARQYFELRVVRGGSRLATISKHHGSLKLMWNYIRFTLPEPILRRTTDSDPLEIQIVPLWTPSRSRYIEWQDGPADGDGFSNFRIRTRSNGVWRNSSTKASVSVFGPRQDVYYLELDTQKDGSFASCADDISHRLIESSHSNGVFDSQHQLIDINNLIASPMTWQLTLNDPDADFSLDEGSSPYDEPLIGVMARLWQGETLLTQGWIISVQPPAHKEDGARTKIALEDRSRQMNYDQIKLDFKRQVKTSDALKEILSQADKGYPYRANVYDNSLLDGDFALYEGDDNGGYDADDSFVRIPHFGSLIEGQTYNGYNVLRDVMLHEMGGYLYTKRDGRIQFKDRYWLHKAITDELPIVNTNDTSAAYLRRQSVRNKFSLLYDPTQYLENELAYDSGFKEVEIVLSKQDTVISEGYHKRDAPDDVIQMVKAIEPVENVDYIAEKTKLINAEDGTELPGEYDPDDPYVKITVENINGVYRNVRTRGQLVSNGRLADRALWDFELGTNGFTATIINDGDRPIIIRRISIRGNVLQQSPRETIERVNLESIYKHGEQAGADSYLAYVATEIEAEAIADTMLNYNSRNHEYIAQIDCERAIGGMYHCFPPEVVDIGIGQIFELVHNEYNVRIKYVIVGERHQIQNGYHRASWAVKPILSDETFFLDISNMDSETALLSY